jgi:hypothetical protein
LATASVTEPERDLLAKLIVADDIDRERQGIGRKHATRSGHHDVACGPRFVLGRGFLSRCRRGDSEQRYRRGESDRELLLHSLSFDALVSGAANRA